MMIRTNAHRRVTTVLIALLVLLWGSTGVGARSTAQAANSRQAPFVLGMGDSVGWGFQAFPMDTNTTFPGFVKRFADRLVSSPQQQVRVVNYSCNGDSTTTMIHGVMGPTGLLCLGKAVADSRPHDDYNGAQLDAAVVFLQQQTSDGIVLLNVGGNDPIDNPTVAACNFDPDCWTEVFQMPSVRDEIHAMAFENYTTILSALLAANPQVRILVLNTYELDQNDLFTATGILDVINTALAEAVAALGSPRVMLVDTTTTFTPEAVCAGELTEWCLSEGMHLSVHPTDAGYVVLTNLACDASRISTTHENHLKCRSGNYPKPVGHGRLKPHQKPTMRQR